MQPKPSIKEFSLHPWYKKISFINQITAATPAYSTTRGNIILIMHSYIIQMKGERKRPAMVCFYFR